MFFTFALSIALLVVQNFDPVKAQSLLLEEKVTGLNTFLKEKGLNLSQYESISLLMDIPKFIYSRNMGRLLEEGAPSLVTERCYNHMARTIVDLSMLELYAVQSK